MLNKFSLQRQLSRFSLQKQLIIIFSLLAMLVILILVPLINKNLNALLELSAVNSIRQLDAHKANDSKTRLDRALTDLGVQPNAISNNYANAIWQVYDSIDEMFANLNIFLSNAPNFK